MTVMLTTNISYISALSVVIPVQTGISFSACECFVWIERDSRLHALLSN